MADNKERLRILWNRMKRRKTISAHDHETKLRRCLTTGQLTMMGVGCTVGVGIYVLVGVAAKEYAGPGVIISFVMAGIVTLINGICFAEFGARIPKTGALYTYVYESTCEILAFVLGWISLVGLLTSGAIAGRAWSGYLDSLFDNYIHNTINQFTGNVTLGPPFSTSLDFLACAYVLFVIIIISLGVHASTFISSILASVSVGVLLFVTVMGLIVGDYSNVVNADHGGFLPYGVGGILTGSAACFYALQGFDVVCMSAEESKTPGKSIPRAIFYELLICTVLYVGTSLGLILLVPYTEINTRAPLPSAFAYRDIQWAKYVVSIGPTLGIGNLNLFNLYTISRQVYCMASDGLLFQYFLKVNEKTQVPVRAAVVFGLLVAVFALLFDMSNLVSFSVIAMFLTSVMSACILILSRAKKFNSKKTSKNLTEQPILNKSPTSENGSLMTNDNSSLMTNDNSSLLTNDNSSLLTNDNSSLLTDENGSGLTNQNGSKLTNDIEDCGEPTSLIGKVAYRIGLMNLLYLVLACSLGLGTQLIKGFEDVQNGTPLAIFSVTALALLIVTLSVLISTLTDKASHEGFSVPFVPHLPVLSILVNIVLLLAAGDVTGIIGFAILTVTGFGIYIALVLFSGSDDTSNGYSINTDDQRALMDSDEDDDDL